MKKSIIYSEVFLNNHKHFNIFNNISESFGHEVIIVQSLDTAIQYMKEGDVGAFFCDEHLYTSDLEEKVTLLNDIDAGFSIILLIPALSRDARLNQRVDNILILSLPHTFFETSVFSVYKYIWNKEKLKGVSGIVNPDFIKKLLSDSAHAINNILKE